MEAVATGTFTAEPVRLSEVLTRESTWSPTRELAEEAAAQLRSASSFSVATSMKTRELPVKSRELTWHMENWYRPIRAWYGDETAGVDYRDEAGSDSMVLEVGILNYEWHTGILSLQVMMRLIDVETGRVVGRTRQWATPAVGFPAELLGGDNRRLKSLVVETARPLVATSLQELRLVTR